jgi:hypothetical protein
MDKETEIVQPVITREAIEARLVELHQGAKQLEANLSATQGAIQDCEFWLAMFADKDTDKTK